MVHKRTGDFLGPKVENQVIRGDETTSELIEKAFNAFVGRELATAYQLIRRMIREDHTIVMSVSGAMTPADLAATCIIPLIQAGIVDVLTTTGANIYHDLQRTIQGEFYAVDPKADDRLLRQQGYTRIYDIVFPEDDLYRTDKFVQELLRKKPFQQRMTTPQFHDLLGKSVAEIERERFGRDPKKSRSLVVQAHLYRVPIFCGAPQDASIHLNVAYLKRRLGGKFQFGIDMETDIHEFGAYHWLAKNRWSKKLSIVILGGGVPKNYSLQPEPYLSQVCGLDVEGYDCDVQFCDAHVQNGGLSSCTAGEAHTWGKTSAEFETNSQYVFTEVTAVLPFVVHGLAQEGAAVPASAGRGAAAAGRGDL
jgi:deoxyhypusine synthase